MDFFEKINNHKYLYLTEIGEPEENELRLLIEEGQVTGPIKNVQVGKVEIEGCSEIKITEDSCVYEVHFESYIGYSVLNESFTSGDDSENYEGHLFRIYSRSHFIDYLKKASFADDDYPGTYKHYGFVCSNHIVHIASIKEPNIKQIKGT